VRLLHAQRVLHAQRSARLAFLAMARNRSSNDRNIRKATAAHYIAGQMEPATASAADAK